MTHAVVALAGAVTALVIGAGEARATNECRGLMVCVPVAGPWVVVPATRHVQYQVACPRRYTVGGLDAELSHRALDVTFPGRLGSPVNPGITTTTSAVFDGFYTGVPRQVTSFRPHIGCIPAAGGGGSPPWFVSLRPAVFPPGRPVIRRVRTVNAVAGRTTRGAQGCARNERLVGASHAVGLYTQTAPATTVATSVSVTRTVRGGRVAVVVRADASLRVRAVAQLHALCAGAGR